ncbi:MAG: heme biosynthesis protein HemY [Gammaproteobacteria bacterium]|nr:heme biosynthesis protein HemY [Gammaproteobacteria bacterium]
MRAGLWIVTALFLGAFAAHFMLQDRGYVLINFRGYSAEMSVPGLLLLLTAAYLAIRAVAAVWHAPRRIGGALAERRIRRSGGRLTRGLMHIAEGDWARAERLLTRGANTSEAPLVSYLMAARAAQLQGSRERRDEWLALAHQQLPRAEKTVLLTQAELQFQDGQHELALATLRRVRDTAPNHPIALALAARACAALGDREQLAGLLPRLGGARLEPQELEDLAAEALTHRFAGQELTRAALDRYWKSLPTDLRNRPRLAVLRLTALDRLGRGDDAERELRALLKRRWLEPYVLAYGRIRASDTAKQLRQAETWLMDRPEDPALLLTAARLAMLGELWGKARSYVETSIAIDPSAESYAVYGDLLDRLGENDRAAVAFRSGLSLTNGGKTEAVPVLAPPRPGE